MELKPNIPETWGFKTPPICPYCNFVTGPEWGCGCSQYCKDCELQPWPCPAHVTAENNYETYIANQTRSPADVIKSQDASEGI